MPPTTTLTAIEPTADDISNVVDGLRKTWTSTITVTRTSTQDVGYRDIYISIDDEKVAILHPGDTVTRDVIPGPHRLKAHNTLFRKTLEVTLSAGERATFSAINRAGFGTYSVLAFFFGGGPIYLAFGRDTKGSHG